MNLHLCLSWVSPVSVLSPWGLKSEIQPPLFPRNRFRPTPQSPLEPPVPLDPPPGRSFHRSLSLRLIRSDPPSRNLSHSAAVTSSTRPYLPPTAKAYRNHNFFLCQPLSPHPLSPAAATATLTSGVSSHLTGSETVAEVLFLDSIWTLPASGLLLDLAWAIMLLLGHLVNGPFWWHLGLEFQITAFLGSMVVLGVYCPLFSIKELVCLPMYSPIFCDIDVGSVEGSTLLVFSVSYLFKDSTVWGVFPSVFVVDYPIVVLAIVASPTSGHRSVSVNLDAQIGDSPQNDIEAEMRGCLDKFRSSRILFAFISFNYDVSCVD